MANYLIGVSFFEVFSFYDNLKLPNSSVTAAQDIGLANELIKNPSMLQKEADMRSRTLIEHFLTLIRQDIQDAKTNKSIRAINDELSCLKENSGEDQSMVDTRLSIVLEEIADLLESQGENLFVVSR